mgnify:FL=1
MLHLRVLLLLASATTRAAAQAATQCWRSDGTYAPCGPGNDQCGPPVAEGLRPRFHIIDQACKVNDPNFPFYDSVHGMWHLMYQDHLIIPSPGAFGPDIGHVISRDFVHWARLPVSIWNDRPYDENGI